MIKNMNKRLKQKMKELAVNRGLSGFKSMNVDELKDLLTENVKGFRLERDLNFSTIKISWLENEKRIGTIISVDLPEGDIIEDKF